MGSSSYKPSSYTPSYSGKGSVRPASGSRFTPKGRTAMQDMLALLSELEDINLELDEAKATVRTVEGKRAQKVKEIRTKMRDLDPATRARLKGMVQDIDID